MVRPTHASVDLDALVANYHAVERQLSASSVNPTPRIIAVIKANAYGHGATRVGLALERAAGSGSGSAPILACADIEEGIELRQAGIASQILIFGALGVSDLAGVFDHNLTPTVSSPSAAQALEVAAASRGVRLGVHLKIDTGMHRFGLRYDNLGATLPPVVRATHLDIEAVYTHFATAERDEYGLFNAQITRFETVRTDAQALGLDNVWWHAANSAALLRDRRTWYDAVRPGLLLYGVVPPPIETELALRPAMSVRSRLVAVKGLRPGETAGYGARFVARRPMRVAVVPAGYADGLDLRLASRGSVLVGGRRAPITTVSMDSMTIDVTDMTVNPGDDVVVLGRQGGRAIEVADIASAINTVPHEILCRIGTRIERTYVQTIGGGQKSDA